MRPPQGCHLPMTVGAPRTPQLSDEPMLLERMARLGLGNWNLPHAFELLAEELWQWVEHDCASFLTYRRDRRALVVQATAPSCGSRLVQGTQVPADEPMWDLLDGSLSAAVCMDTISSCSALERYLYELNLRSCITIPLQTEAGSLGLLNLSSRRRGHFQSDERAALQRLQQPLAVALQHLTSNQQQSNSPRFFERSADLERMRWLHELTGGISHRLNNVFASVLGNARLALDANPTEEVAKYLERLYQEGLEGARIVHAMQQFASAQTPRNAEKVDLAAVIESVAQITNALWRHQVQSRNIDFQCAIDHDVTCTALAYAPELREATVNLVFNAIQALPEGGEIHLQAESSLPWATITVRDNGVGMDQEIVRRCTTPFFTTRKNSDGLGMSIAAGVARKYGGHIEVVSQPDKGTEVRLVLPAADQGL